MSNKKFNVVCSPLLAIILCISVLAQNGGGVNRSMRDSTCKSCENFYQYADGGWLTNNMIPPTDTPEELALPHLVNLNFPTVGE